MLLKCLEGWDDKSGHVFSLITDDGYLLNEMIGTKGAFYHLRSYVFATRSFHEILYPVGYPQFTVFFKYSRITGSEKTVTGKHLGGCVGFLVIAFHYIPPTNQNFAIALIDLYFNTGKWFTHCAKNKIRRLVTGNSCGCFGETIPVGDEQPAGIKEFFNLLRKGSPGTGEKLDVPPDN